MYGIGMFKRYRFRPVAVLTAGSIRPPLTGLPLPATESNTSPGLGNARKLPRMKKALAVGKGFYSYLYSYSLFPGLTV